MAMNRYSIIFGVLLALGSAGPVGAADASENPPAKPGGDAQTEAKKPLPDLPDPFKKDSGAGMVEDAKRKASVLTPDQIKAVADYLDAVKYGANASEPGGEIAKPVTSSVIADLSPGAVPLVVRMSRSMGSTLVFTDMSGTPWPVKGYKNFNESLFDVENPSEGGNLLTIRPNSYYGAANVMVVLEGLSTPIVLTAVTGQKEVDYRLDVKVPGANPKHPAALPASIGAAAPDQPTWLSPFLDGLPPKEAKKLQSNTPVVRAWQDGENYVIVTRASLLSPAYLDSLGAADGTRAYSIHRTPTILVSVDGNPVKVDLNEVQ